MGNGADVAIRIAGEEAMDRHGNHHRETAAPVCSVGISKVFQRIHKLLKLLSSLTPASLLNGTLSRLHSYYQPVN